MCEAEGWEADREGDAERKNAHEIVLSLADTSLSTLIINAIMAIGEKNLPLMIMIPDTAAIFSDNKRFPDRMSQRMYLFS